VDKLIDFIIKAAIISGLIYAIYWLISTINTWSLCLISISSSLKVIAEKLS